MLIIRTEAIEEVEKLPTTMGGMVEMGEVIKTLKKVPSRNWEAVAGDIVAITRCEKCRWADKSYNPFSNRECYWCVAHNIGTTARHFCAYGEQKEEHLC